MQDIRAISDFQLQEVWTALVEPSTRGDLSPNVEAQTRPRCHSQGGRNQDNLENGCFLFHWGQATKQSLRIQTPPDPIPSIYRILGEIPFLGHTNGSLFGMKKTAEYCNLDGLIKSYGWLVRDSVIADQTWESKGTLSNSWLPFIQPMNEQKLGASQIIHYIPK